MTVNELIKKLKLTAEASYISDPRKKDIKVYVSSDEEWNTLFQDIEIQLDEDNNIVIFGLSGSEKEDD